MRAAQGRKARGGNTNAAGVISTPRKTMVRWNGRVPRCPSGARHVS